MTLTPRQEQVAALVAQGLRDKQIGGALRLHPNTIRWHVGELAKHLKLSTDHDTRVLIARWWWEHHDAAPRVA